MDYLMKIRKDSPRILNLTNEVAANFNANGLLAIGASPAMANMAQEVRESAKRMHAVVLNTGALTIDRSEAIYVAGRAANEARVPVVLDPVAVGMTVFRTTFIQELLADIKFAAIRGNAGEIAVLGGSLTETLGPDNLLLENNPSIAEYVARKYDTTVISTGKIDVITDGNRTVLCKNGHEMLQNITASGCTLSSVVGAFVSVAKDNLLDASIEAIVRYNIAAEWAMEKATGPGTFYPAFLDQLYLMSGDYYQTYAKIEQVRIQR